MKRTLKIILSLLLIPALLWSLSLSLFAEETEKEEWMLSEDGSTLTKEDKSYQRLNLSNDYLNIGDIKRMGAVNVGEQSYHLGSSENDPDLIVLYKYVSDIKLGKFYAAFYSRDKIQEIEELLDGRFEHYLINDAWYLSTVNTDTVNRINAALDDRGQEMDVSRFASADCYDLWGSNVRKTLVKRIGVFFDTAEGLYYVDFTSLPNDSFDSEGNLSTREGTVSAILLDDDLQNEVTQAMKSYHYGKPTQTALDHDESPAVYWVPLIVSGLIFGFLTPLVPLLFSVVMLVRKKTLHPYRYVVLAVLSVLWMILTLLVTVVTVI